TPRLLTAAGAVYLQITLAVSGSSAMMSRPAVTYIRPPTTSGVTWMPLAPVSKVHAGCSRATLAGVICLSGEKRWPPASRSWDGQSEGGSEGKREKEKVKSSGERKRRGKRTTILFRLPFS